MGALEFGRLRARLITASIAIVASLMPGQAVAEDEDEDRPTDVGDAFGGSLGVEGPVRMLVLGDSHTYQTFGQALDAQLRRHRGVEVTTFGSCGAGIHAFLVGRRNRLCTRLIDEDGRVQVTRDRGATEPLHELLDVQPDVVVIALGANNLRMVASDPDAFRRLVRRMVATVQSADAHCLWIGPPDGANKPPRLLARLYRILDQELEGRCELFDSRGAALPYLDYRGWDRRKQRRWDGAHFDSMGESGRALSRRWARDAEEWIEAELMATPPRREVEFQGVPEPSLAPATLDDLTLELH